MFAARTERILAAAGLLYPVLSVVGFAAFPQPPGGDVSAAHDPQWLIAHTGTVIGQSYIRALAALAFLVLAVAVARAVTPTAKSPSLPRLIVAGGAGCSILLLLAQATTLSAALATRDHLSPSVIPVFDSLNQGFLSLSSLPAVLLFAAAGAAFLHHASAPRWLTVLTLVGVPLALLDAASYDGGPLAAVGIMGLAYFLVWSLSTAAYLARRGPVIAPDAVAFAIS